MVTLAMRFPASQVQHWAGRYVSGLSAEESAREERVVGRIAPSARDKGWPSKAELQELCYWKTPRSRGLVAKNDEATVKRLTIEAFSTSEESRRPGALMELHGVAWPTASAILHVVHTDPYPMLDPRALWSLGVDEDQYWKLTYNFAFWWPYVEFCRQLAASCRVDMRTLDRALYRYSYEKQPRHGPLP